MPLAPLSPCPAPHCNQLTADGRCHTHRKQLDKARGSASERGYTPEWAAYSKRWLTKYPFCGQRQDGKFHHEDSRCVQRGKRTLATCTDHILALRDGGKLLDPWNHQSLCNSCNAAKAVIR